MERVNKTNVLSQAFRGSFQLFDGFVVLGYFVTLVFTATFVFALVVHKLNLFLSLFEGALLIWSAYVLIKGYILRSAADRMMVELEQMPDKDEKDIWVGMENLSVSRVIDHLRRLTPLGKKLVWMYRRSQAS